MGDNKPDANSRRDFLKMLGLASASTLIPLSGCGNKQSVSNSSDSGPVPDDKMTYRENPRNGDKVSLLGYGCMRLPKIARADSTEDGDDLDQEAINASINYAIAHGINYFDTSPAYCKGGSERATGLALSKHSRNKFYIATKLSNFRDSSKEGSIEMYNNSFKALQVEYIDYYLLHALGLGGIDAFKARYVDNGVLEFLMKEREAGCIRNLGWSFHGKIEDFDYFLSLNDLYKWDFVQIQLNYIDWVYPQGYNTVSAKYACEELKKRNIPVMIMEPLLGGRLARPHYKAQQLLKQAEPEQSFASWAFRFAGTPSNVLTVLSGMTYMEHMQDNIRTYAPLKPLSQKEFELLDQAAKIMSQYQNIPCTACQYCMPCPYGIDIPGAFSHYNRCMNDGNFPDNEQDPEYRKARRAFLISLDRNVEKLRQASHCTGCGICLRECPQNIKIPQEMVKIDQFVEKLKVFDKGAL